MKYILISLTFIILALLLIRPVNEADTWMHIKTGEIMVKDMRITQVDEYSYTKTGEKWLNHQWLSQVIFYLIYKFSGINGLIIFSAIIIFFAFVFLFINLYRKDSWLLAVFLTLLVILFSQYVFLARPLIFSLLLFSLFILILHRYKYALSSAKDNLYIRPPQKLMAGSVFRLWLWFDKLTTSRTIPSEVEGKPGWAPLYALIPLQILWVNLHGSSIMGIFLIWAFIIGEFIDTRIRHDFKNEFVIKGNRYKKLLFVGIALIISSGINPYGYSAIFFPIVEFKGMGFINEWAPSVYKDIFLNFDIMPYYRLFLLISILVFIFKGRAISSSHIIIFGSLLYLSLSGKRHLSLYGFAIAPCIVEYLKGINFKAVSLRLRKFFLYFASIVLVLYLVVLGKDIVTGRYYANQSTYRWFGLGRVNYPEEAMNFLEKSGLEGNMFNDYSSGCFLIERLYPLKKVFLDGRNTIYGAKFITENYGNCLKDPLLFEALVKKYDINYVFLYYGFSNMAALIPHLYYSQNWQLVFLDDKVCIFARNIERNASLIKKYHVDLTKIKEVAKLNRYSWQRAYPMDYINRAIFYETVGLVDMAIITLKDILVIAPYARDVRYNLGALYLKKEMYEDAIKEFKQAIKINMMDADAYNNLGVAYARTAKYKDAIEQFKKVLFLYPLHVDAKRNLRSARIDFEMEKLR